MSGVFTVRNTALGAGALIVVAVLVTDRSGLGGTVDRPAAPPQELVPEPVSSHAAAVHVPAAWYAATPEVSGPAPPPVPVPQAEPAVPGEIRPPDPVGPDFPPELNARR